MKATCPQCGEELLGAVNRCWRCGAEFASNPDEAGPPPVQHAPGGELNAAGPPVNGETEPEERADVVAPPVDLALSAETGDTAAEENEAIVATEVIDEAEPPVVVPLEGVHGGRPQGALGAKPKGVPRPRVKGRYGVLFGVTAILIGVVACGFSIDSLWALPLGVLGVVTGACGLIGQRRGAALAGILICCIALTLSGYRALIAAYTWYTGYDPFDQRPVEEVLFEEPDEDDDWAEEESDGEAW
jgi:hypothetical protein